MSAQKDGGSAFPRFTKTTRYTGEGVDGRMHEEVHEVVEGATLRDLFAMAALQGILANPTCDGNGPVIAGLAFKLADSMLKEREK